MWRELNLALCGIYRSTGMHKPILGCEKCQMPSDTPLRSQRRFGTIRGNHAGVLSVGPLYVAYIFLHAPCGGSGRWPVLTKKIRRNMKRKQSDRAFDAIRVFSDGINRGIDIRCLRETGHLASTLRNLALMVTGRPWMPTEQLAAIAEEAKRLYRASRALRWRQGGEAQLQLLRLTGVQSIRRRAIALRVVTRPRTENGLAFCDRELVEFEAIELPAPTSIWARVWNRIFARNRKGAAYAI